MRTKPSEADVNLVVNSIIPLTLTRLPFNGQSDDDKKLCEHFVLRSLNSQVTSRLKKIEDQMKEAYKTDPERHRIKITDNWRRELSEGTPRSMFDLDTFIAKIVEKYGEYGVMAHSLRELAVDSNKMSATPIKTEIEYIGDIPKAEEKD